jgi:hypothetical protein
MIIRMKDGDRPIELSVDAGGTVTVVGGTVTIREGEVSVETSPKGDCGIQETAEPLPDSEDFRRAAERRAARSRRRELSGLDRFLSEFCSTGRGEGGRAGHDFVYEFGGATALRIMHTLPYPELLLRLSGAVRRAVVGLEDASSRVSSAEITPISSTWGLNDGEQFGFFPQGITLVIIDKKTGEKTSHRVSMINGDFCAGDPLRSSPRGVIELGGPVRYQAKARDPMTFHALLSAMEAWKREAAAIVAEE